MDKPWILSFAHRLVITAAEAGTVGNLLTGGGFAVVVAVIAGAFAWLNNKSGAAKSIAEGAKELVAGNTAEMVRARQDAEEARAKYAECNRDLELARREAAEARKDMRNAHDSLEDAQKAIRAGQNERAKLRAWIRDSCEKNAAHMEWDVELQEALVQQGTVLRPAPPLATEPPA